MPAPHPQPGDVVVRSTFDIRFDLVDHEGHLIVGYFETATETFARARIEANGAAIWLQRFDMRGCALGRAGLIEACRPPKAV